MAKCSDSTTASMITLFQNEPCLRGNSSTQQLRSGHNVAKPNCFKTVLKLFCLSSISLYGRQKRQHNPNSHMLFHYPLSVLLFIHSPPSHPILSSSAYRAFAFHCYLLLQLSILFWIICQTTISTEKRRPFACSKQPCLSRRYQISIRM